MARTPSIAFAKNSPVLLLRAEYMAITGGNHCAAMVLSQMQYWHEIKVAGAAQAKAHNDAARRGGKEETQDTELWFYKAHHEMKEELLGLFGDKAIAAAYGFLLEKGYIRSRFNPRYNWDRARQYLFDVDAVQVAIDALNAPSEEPIQAEEPEKQPADLPGSMSQNCDIEGADLRPPTRNFAAPMSQNCALLEGKETLSGDSLSETLYKAAAVPHNDGLPANETPAAAAAENSLPPEDLSSLLSDPQRAEDLLTRFLADFPDREEEARCKIAAATGPVGSHARYLRPWIRDVYTGKAPKPLPPPASPPTSPGFSEKSPPGRSEAPREPSHPDWAAWKAQRDLNTAKKDEVLR